MDASSFHSLSTLIDFVVIVDIFKRKEVMLEVDIHRVSVLVSLRTAAALRSNSKSLLVNM